MSTSPSALPCVTCNQPLPQGEEKLEYFAQYRTTLADDVIGRLGDGAEELKILLQYVQSTLVVVPEAADIDHEIPINLSRLARDLCEEAQRRLDRLADSLGTLYTEARKEG